MDRLLYYRDQEGNEYLAIGSPEFEEEQKLDPDLTLIGARLLDGEFQDWPTDRLFSVDMNK